MNSNIDDSNPWLKTLVQREYELRHYFELSMQKTLEREEDIEFIANILEEAENNATLASILDRLDDVVSSELPGKVESLEVYKKKQPWLSEYLVCSDPEFYLLLQKHLSVRKFYDGPLDGIYGENTKQAVEKFKQKEGIDEPDIGLKTITRIFSPQKYQYVLLQEHLLNRQLYDGLIDGIFGKDTEKAVEKFKHKEGIDEPDFGSQTIKRILDSEKKLCVLFQEHLSKRKLYDGYLDGICGEKTKEAIDKFNQKEGINEPDLGLKTLDKILAS